jgi:hypothetical protein
MRYVMIMLISLLLASCATTSKEQLYYDTAKSISKDTTISQAACFAAVTEIAKGGDTGVRVGAIALAEKCKVETIKIEAPKKNLLGL